MTSSTNTTTTPLSLRPKDAAKALGIGQRKLWELTHPRGPIPCVRVGCAVLYPVSLLRAWLAEQAAKPATIATGTPGDAPKTEGGAA